MRGAMIWAEPPDDRPYSHPEYEPFWAAAQDLNMPLSLHILTARSGTGANPTSGNDFLLSLANLHHQIEALDFCAGVRWRIGEISWFENRLG